MAEFINDQDRAEAVKNWLNKYAGSVVLGVILGLAVLYGMQYWQGHMQQTRDEASTAYQELLAMPEDKQVEHFQEKAQSIISAYPKTPYASLASFILTKSYIESEQYQNAVNQLDWVYQNAKDKGLRQIAQIRMARIYLSMKQYDKALAILDKRSDTDFNVMTDEVIGDVYLAQNDMPKAKYYYTKAIKDNPDSAILQPLLTVKLHSLPTELNSGENHT